jgi:hypothetical protein
MKVQYFASPSTAPKIVAMIRGRIEVREAVIRNRMACSLRMNQRARFWQWAEFGNRP